MQNPLKQGHVAQAGVAESAVPPIGLPAMAVKLWIEDSSGKETKFPIRKVWKIPKKHCLVGSGKESLSCVFSSKEFHQSFSTAFISRSLDLASRNAKLVKYLLETRFLVNAAVSWPVN